MKTYELLIVTKPVLDQEEADAVIDKIGETVSSYKGKMLSVDKIGRKKLAYEISNFKDGYFATLRFELPAEKVAELKRQLRLNENIIRTMYVEVSKVSA